MLVLALLVSVAKTMGKTVMTGENIAATDGLVLPRPESAQRIVEMRPERCLSGMTHVPAHGSKPRWLV